MSEPATLARPVEVFYSYSHQDERLRDRLEKHLGGLRRQGAIAGWHDRRIGAGTEWEGEIDSHLNTADVILLLVSPDFIDSDYCWGVEVKRAMERHEAGEARVIPVILHAVDWQGAPFGKLEALPRDAKPITSWSNQNEAFLDVARGVRAAVEALAARAAEAGAGTERPPAVEPAGGPPAMGGQPEQARFSAVHQPFEPEMILIPAGKFLMGSDPKKDTLALEDEQPQHTLYLPDYCLAKTPVTNTQYAAFVKATAHTPPAHWEGGEIPPGRENHPVVNISLHDAPAYCSWLSKVTGRSYRLPNEAEWEKGARGAGGRIWPWGDDWDPKRCNSKERGIGDTTPVGAYPDGASPYGLLDMAGNVWEWTSSLSRPHPYREDEPRVARGGSFFDGAEWVRCACRGHAFPVDAVKNRGFRVAASSLYSDPMISSGPDSQ